MPASSETRQFKTEVNHIKIYGPYLDKNTKRLAWWVIDEEGKKYVVRAKTDLLVMVDKLTTAIKGNIDEMLR